MNVVEVIAAAIMCARPNGGCIVKDWQREAKDNPHVETALNQAQAALTALEAHGQVIVPVELLQRTVTMRDDFWEQDIIAMLEAAKTERGEV